MMAKESYKYWSAKTHAGFHTFLRRSGHCYDKIKNPHYWMLSLNELHSLFFAQSTCDFENIQSRVFSKNKP